MAVFGRILLFFFKFCTFEKMPENQLLAKKQVTLALMVLFGLFHLLKLARACTSSDKPEKVLCRFTDASESYTSQKLTEEVKVYYSTKRYHTIGSDQDK